MLLTAQTWKKETNATVVEPHSATKLSYRFTDREHSSKAKLSQGASHRSVHRLVVFIENQAESRLGAEVSGRVFGKHSQNLGSHPWPSKEQAKQSGWWNTPAAPGTGEKTEEHGSLDVQGQPGRQRWSVSKKHSRRHSTAILRAWRQGRRA